MIKKGLYSILFISLLGMVNAQELSLHLNKDKVKIGEPFTLELRVKSKEKLDDIFYKAQTDDFIGLVNLQLINPNSEEVNQTYQLEIAEEFKDSIFQEDTYFVWRGIYTLIGWDSTFVVIPPEHIQMNDSVFQFPPGLIQIESPVLNENQSFYDINELFSEVPKTPFSIKELIKNHLFWIGILGIAVSLFYYFKRRKQREKIGEEGEKTSLEIALLAIEKLEKSEFYEKDVKEYYYTLSTIIKVFLAAHFQTSILEKTTDEVNIILALYQVEKEDINEISSLLRQADMVKFAKSKPTKEEVLNVTNRARKIVKKVAEYKMKDGE